MSARDEILARIRAADAGSAAIATAPAPRTEARRGSAELFLERVADYRAAVRRGGAADAGAAIADACVALGIAAAAVPPGFPWEVEGVALTIDAPPLAPADLDAIGAALVTARIGIAETGTAVLVGGAAEGGRRQLSLVPDRLVIVVAASALVADVDDAFVALAAELEAGSPLTLISGPSATSDIELKRVEGVHGPRHLAVVMVEDARVP